MTILVAVPLEEQILNRQLTMPDKSRQRVRTRSHRIGVIGNISPPTGGAEVFLKHLLQKLITDYKVKFSLVRWREQTIALGPDSTFSFRYARRAAQEIRHEGFLRIFYLLRITFCSRFTIALQLLGQALRAVWFFWRENVCVLHCHLLVPNVYFAWFVAVVLRLKWVVTIHGLVDITEAPSLLPDTRGDPRPITPLERRFLVYVLRHASCVIAVSREIAQACRALGIVNVRQIGGAVDTDFFAPVDKSARGVLFVGNLNSRKGYDLLLDAYAAMSPQIEDPLLIAGKTPGNIAIERENVHYLGDLDRDTLHAHMQQCKLLVLPSQTEGLPLCVLEAMACNKPVLVSRVGELPYLIEAGKNGFLLPELNVTSLTQMLDRLVTRYESVKRRLGDAPRRTALRYSLARVAKKHYDLYLSLTAPSSES